jgi:ferredoxin
MSEQLHHKLRVNPILCDGYGYCAEIVPERIALDDWGFPIVSGKSIEDEDVLNHARRAVGTCPRLALLLEEIPSRATERA